jgi:hypothetical protein
MTAPRAGCGVWGLEPSALKIIAPGDDMRPGNGTEFLRADDAGEPHEVADGDLVDPFGPRVADVVEPLDLRRDLGEPLKLGGGKAPLGRGDGGRQL